MIAQGYLTTVLQSRLQKNCAICTFFINQSHIFGTVHMMRRVPQEREKMSKSVYYCLRSIYHIFSFGTYEKAGSVFQKRTIRSKNLLVSQRYWNYLSSLFENLEKRPVVGIAVSLKKRKNVFFMSAHIQEKNKLLSKLRSGRVKNRLPN